MACCPTTASNDIRALVADMPYGALVSARLGGSPLALGLRQTPKRPILLADVAIYLETLREVLRETADRITDDRRELNGYRSDVAGMRRLLGLDPGQYQ